MLARLLALQLFKSRATAANVTPAAEGPKEDGRRGGRRDAEAAADRGGAATASTLLAADRLSLADPHAPALRCASDVMPWDELTTERLPAIRRALGPAAGRGRVVAVFAPPGLEAAAASAAVLQSGGCLLPLDAASGHPEALCRERLLARAAPSALLTTEPWLREAREALAAVGLYSTRVLDIANAWDPDYECGSPTARSDASSASSWLLGPDDDESDTAGDTECPSGKGSKAGKLGKCDEADGAAVEGATDDAFGNGVTEEAAAPTVSPEAPALVALTAGATGAPKAVVISHGALAARVQHLAALLNATPDDTHLCCLPASDAGGVTTLLLALATGGCAAICSPPEPPTGPSAAARTVSEAAIAATALVRSTTVLHATPSLANRLLASPPLRASLLRARDLRIAALSGEPAQAPLLIELHKLLPYDARILGLYGSSEAGPAWAQELIDREDPFGPCGGLGGSSSGGSWGGGADVIAAQDLDLGDGSLRVAAAGPLGGVQVYMLPDSALHPHWNPANGAATAAAAAAGGGAGEAEVASALVPLHLACPGTRGELFIAGEGLASGYLPCGSSASPAAEAAWVPANPSRSSLQWRGHGAGGAVGACSAVRAPSGRLALRTGDTAVVLPCGRVVFSGPAARFAGPRLRGTASSTIAAPLAGYPGATGAFAVEAWGDGAAVACVCPETVDAHAAAATAATALPSALVPARVVAMPEPPLLPGGGKADLRALRALLTAV